MNLEKKVGTSEKNIVFLSLKNSDTQIMIFKSQLWKLFLNIWIQQNVTVKNYFKNSMKAQAKWKNKLQVQASTTDKMQIQLQYFAIK